MMTLAEAAWQHYAEHRPRCTTTDLPAAECGCPRHHHSLPTVISAAALERLAGHPLPSVRMLRRREWCVPEPTRTVCTHRKDDLCGDCATLLEGLLDDLPEIVEQLTITLRKGHRFAPKGVMQGDTTRAEEAPIPWNPPAVRCLSDIHRFQLAAPLNSRHWILTELSSLARRAHRIIDRPQDREVTMCPKCRAEIVVMDRARTVTCRAVVVEDDPSAPEPREGEQRAQRERVCTYAASWEQHRKDLLQVNQDAMLTMKQLVGVFAEPGIPPEKIRSHVRYLEKRHGLPREQIRMPYWRDGELHTRDQWVYRLGDVQTLMATVRREQAS